MDARTIKEVLTSVLPMSKQDGDAEKKKTVFGTFHIGVLTGNRLNSGTLRSQFIICESISDWDKSQDARKALHSDQRVFVQTGDDIWDIYAGETLDSESKEPVVVAQNRAGLLSLLIETKAKLLPSASTPTSATNGGDFARPDILAAIRTKPFILLAGISGTGKSRMVRQLAHRCCPEKDAAGNAHPLYNKQKPGNFEMIQVRPNWHDSTELMGYITRITASKAPEYVLTDFVRFLAQAWLFPDVPFFLCLDEMNLAPVEQYFAEYLSVIETRCKDGAEIVTDVLVKLDKEIRKTTLDRLFEDVDHGNAQPLIDRFNAAGGIPIPPNFIVMGTVNMDETTCTFSRKVLDRAMSFELNEVKMRDGLGNAMAAVVPIPPTAALASHLKPDDFYTGNESVCDAVIGFLEAVNAILDKTPFKIAYRTRDEVMLYCIERTADGVSLSLALDEAASMKILSRIEGDETAMRLPRDAAIAAGDKDAPKNILQLLRNTILAELSIIDGTTTNGGSKPDFAALAKKYPICASKLDEMDDRLATDYTGFWR